MYKLKYCILDQTEFNVRKNIEQNRHTDCFVLRRAQASKGENVMK